jgi:methyl-accepting chemotaxis protein
LLLEIPMRGIAFSRLLMVVVLVPVVGLAIFGGRLTYDSWAGYSDLNRASSTLRLAVATARFGGIAIPGEGGASREFVTAGGGDRAKLDAARKTTDEHYRAIREAAAALSIYDPKLTEQLRLLDDRMNAMLALRQKIDANEIKVAAATTAVIAPAAAQAIDVLGTAAAVVNDPLLSRRMFALYATVQFVENAMVQRGVGEAALKDGKLPPEPYLLLARGVTLNATFGKLLRDYAQPEIYDLYKAFDAANGRDLAELRQFGLANAGTPASDAQRKRWSELSRDLTAVAGKILVATVNTLAADGEQMLADARRATFIYLGIFVAVLIAVVLLSRQVLRTLRELLGGLAGAVDKMRDGHYDVDIPHTQRADEIGIMARATAGFRDNFMRVKEQETAEKNARDVAERKALLAKIAGDFEAVVGGIVGAVSSASGELTSTAGTLTKTADSTQQLSTTVAAASEEASTNVQSVASATEEMVASITEIGRQVQESNHIASEAVSQAAKTDDRITKLAQAASRIGDVTQLITTIAEQTNLLALNATIEAARAGEAGKGFAVVAQEVKQLASQTGKATNEISTQIAEMQAATQESVTAIKEIGGTIRRISEIATTIASAVEEQGAATQEITRNIQQAAHGTTQVASNITEVSNGAAMTGSGAAQVLTAAHSLAEQSTRLKTEVDKFLGTVRAA